MTLNFKLTPFAPPPDFPDDDLDRPEIGYRDGDSDQQVYERNRGVWLLGPRARQQRYVTFSKVGEHRVFVVVELERIEDIARRAGGRPRQAIVGRVLGPGDPGYDALYGSEVDQHRNPVTYTPDPAGDPPGCACGCGEPVRGGRLWVSGHDQRAVHERISRQWGSALGFVRWFDRTFPADGYAPDADPPAAG